MSSLSVFFTYLLTAVFVCNTVFFSGGGSTEAPLLDEKPKAVVASGGLISFYSFFATLISAGVTALFPDAGRYIIVYGLVFCLAVLFVYLVLARAAVKWEGFGSLFGRLLAPTAVNCAVAALPLAVRNAGDVSLAALLGVALGSGVGFAAAVFLLRFARPLTDSRYIPSPFRGVPAMLIYIGLISLSLSVIDGGLKIR